MSNYVKSVDIKNLDRLFVKERVICRCVSGAGNLIYGLESGKDVYFNLNDSTITIKIPREKSISFNGIGTMLLDDAKRFFDQEFSISG